MKNLKIISSVAAVVLAFSAVPASTAFADFETKNGKTYYYDEDGNMEKGLEEIDGETYYFNSKGVMQTGWQTIKKKYKAYFRKDGTMVKGSAKIKGKSYYFDTETGYMQTGNVNVSGVLKQFNNKGVYVKTYKNALVKIDGKYYYAGKNGKVTYGLVKTSDGNYYYFGDNGYAISTEYSDGNYNYVLDKNTGLVSKEEIKKETTKADDGVIKAIKLDSYREPGTKLILSKYQNSTNGKFTYKGVLQNIAYPNGCKVSVSMILWDKNGYEIDTIKISTSFDKVGDEYEFEGYEYYSDQVSKITFEVNATSK